MPRMRSRKRACSRPIATNWRCDAAAAPRPASAIPSGTSSPAAARISAASGSASSTASTTRAGETSASAAAGSQRANRPSSDSIRSTANVASSPACAPRVARGPAPNSRTNRSDRSRRRASTPAEKARSSDMPSRTARTAISIAKVKAHGCTVTALSGPRTIAAASRWARHQAWPIAAAVASIPNKMTGRTASRPMAMLLAIHARPGLGGRAARRFAIGVVSPPATGAPSPPATRQPPAGWRR